LWPPSFCSVFISLLGIGPKEPMPYKILMGKPDAYIHLYVHMSPPPHLMLPYGFPHKGI
jgi:hypothetical protein